MLRIERFHFHDVERLNSDNLHEYRLFNTSISSPSLNTQYANQVFLFPMDFPNKFLLLSHFSKERNQEHPASFLQQQYGHQNVTHQFIAVIVFHNFQTDVYGSTHLPLIHMQTLFQLKYE